jgi:hypothetical protein
MDVGISRVSAGPEISAARTHEATIGTDRTVREEENQMERKEKALALLLGTIFVFLVTCFVIDGRLAGTYTGTALGGWLK